jgi:branched-chain amino acid transport system permease protein
MNLQFMLFILINGLSQGMVLFIIASGLSLVFGVLRVINFAHGSLYMIGAFMAFSLSSLFAGKTLFAFLMLMLLVPPGVAILGNTCCSFS